MTVYLADHALQNRRALMHSAAGIFISCLIALLYEAVNYYHDGRLDTGYLVNFIAGLFTSALTFDRSRKGHPRQAAVILGTLLVILCFHTTVLMGLGLRAPIMVLVCVLILGTNFTLGRKPARQLLWASLILVTALFMLEQWRQIPGMSLERNPPAINAYMVLLCLYICAYVFSSAFQQRSDRALAELARQNIALEQALSDKHKALEDRERALEETARAQASKDRFLATMSHELRTPMAGMRTAITLLQNPRVTDSARARYLAALDTTTDSLLALLNDLLDTAQLEAGAMSVKTRPVDLERLLMDSVALFELSAQQKNLTLTHDIQIESGQTVLADPARLRQMISNLLGNAIKFTSKGGIHVQVSQPLPDTQPEMWMFRITDTGPGISTQDQERLFKPFSQLDNQDSHAGSGSGLGLSIVQKLARAMGGESGVFSTVGEGSTFWFSVQLPAAEREQHAVAA